MKKILAIFLGMLLVLGFAASAFAIHLDIPSDDSTPAVAKGTASITLSGEIRVRYDFRHVAFTNNAPDVNFFDQRVRLGVEAKVTPNTTGFIQLETDTGDTGAPDSVVWGAPNNDTATGAPGSATGVIQDPRTLSKGYPAIAQVGNNLKPGFSILNAWILHQGTGLLGVNAGFKIGHQPIILPNGIFLDHSYYGDDGIVAFVNPVKELELDAVYLKLRDQSTNLSDSTNGYAFIAQYKPSKDTAIAFDATYLDVQNVGETASQSATLDPDVHLWNFGLHANTAISGFTMMVDGEVQTGTEEITGISGGHNLLGGTGNENFRGYAAKAAVGYKLNPVKLTLEAAYGSGNDGSSNNKDGTFITFQGPVPHFSYVYDYRTVNAAGAQYGGLENVMYLKLDGNADVTKDVNVDVAVMELQAAHDIKTVKGTTGLNYTIGSEGGATNSRNIGTEADATISYMIDKGLKLYVEGGYLWAGNFWQALHAVGTGTSPKDAYTVREGIILNF